MTTSPLPQCVVFDLGKVLLHFDYGRAASRLQEHCRITAAEIREALDQSALLYRYETNLLSTEDFFSEVQTVSGFRGTLAEFRPLFSDIFSPIEPMIELHAALRARGVPTFIFSNTNALAIEFIHATYPFFKNFDGYIYSFEHGAMKPDAKLYDVVERQTGLSGPAILYIDDRAENIEAGANRTWQAVLHETPEQTKAAVARTGLLG